MIMKVLNILYKSPAEKRMDKRQPGSRPDQWTRYLGKRMDVYIVNGIENKVLDKS